MMPWRLSAIDSARRTRTSPSAPLKLEMMKASVDQPGPWKTLTELLLFSWSRVGSANEYDPWIPLVSMAEVNADTSEAPLIVICWTRGLAEEFQEGGMGSATP